MKFNQDGFLKAPLLVKVKKYESDGEYIFEFNLNEDQVNQIRSDALVNLVTDNKVTVVHKHHIDFDQAKEWVDLLNDTLSKYPDMNQEIKDMYYKRILSYSEEFSSKEKELDRYQSKTTK